MHTDNKKTEMLVSGEVSTQGLHGTTIGAEVKVPFNFSKSRESLVSATFTLIEATAFSLLKPQKYFNSNQKSLK